MNSIFLPPRQRFQKNDKGVMQVDLREIRAYTGHGAKKATKTAKTCRQDLAKEWIKLNPQTPEETGDFYTKTEGYLYDLYTWTHDPHMWELFDKVITGDERVLDYGAGIGDISIYLAEKGCEVTAVELPNSKTKQFLMWRVYQRKLGDQISFDFDDTKDEFDVILAIDVLEHLHFPLRYTVQLGKMLKERSSWFFCTPTFNNDVGVHPMHLPENYWLGDMKTFANAMTSLAFGPKFPLEEYLPIWHPMFKPGPPIEKKD